jgi:hypothetical protein
MIRIGVYQFFAEGYIYSTTVLPVSLKLSFLSRLRGSRALSGNAGDTRTDAEIVCAFLARFDLRGASLVSISRLDVFDIHDVFTSVAFNSDMKALHLEQFDAIEFHEWK